VAEPAPAQPAATFVKTADARAPHLPRFSQVPDTVKHPLGPYRQAPAEFGGDWWYVNPFTGTEPWLNIDPPAASLTEEGPVASAEFLSVFGERPTSATSNNPRIDVIEWDQNLEHFKGVGIPEGFTQEQVDAANQLYESWGMGPATFYEGRYGWRAHFANGFEASPHTAIEVPHLVVAQYQTQMALLEGLEPEVRHPFVPPGVWPDGGSSSDA
jgi:hypothetical protein